MKAVEVWMGREDGGAWDCGYSTGDSTRQAEEHNIIGVFAILGVTQVRPGEKYVAEVNLRMDKSRIVAQTENE